MRFGLGALPYFMLAVLAASPNQAVAGEEPHCHGGSATADPAGLELEIPDVAVVDQEGRELRFVSDLIAGKVVAMNFVFTTCTTVCPPMGAIFGRLQSRLGDRVGRDVHLVSVSIDPATDSPERLKAWSRRFDAGSGWTLVTGDKREITRLLKALGVFTAGFEDHSPLLLVGDGESGRWTRSSGLTPPDLIAEMLDGYSGTKVALEVAP